MSIDKPIDYTVSPKKDCARYKMHKYWAAKPWYVVAEYIRHFTCEGEIVMDPFCGSGVVGCEALINRRKAVLNDLNPMATFIALNLCRSPVDMDKFKEEFTKIQAELKDPIMDMYRLSEPCPKCGKALYAKHLVRGPSLEGRWVVEARCAGNHGRSGHIRRLLTSKEKVAIKLIEDREISYWFPQNEFPDGREIMRLKNAGITKTDGLFTRRNLLALSMIYEKIQEVTDIHIKELMLMAFSNTLLHASKLKSENLRPMSANSYYCMDDWIEENVWQRFENRVKWHWGVFEGKRETNQLIGNYFKPAQSFDEMTSGKTFMISNGPAQNLSNIPDKSIDYCFTDPPYGGSIQYFELTYLWRSWLNMSHEFMQDEITVNDFQGKKDDSFENMLTEAFCEIYRVLKPGHWLSVTFNNRDTKIWIALLKACQAAGFKKVNVVPQNPVGHSFVQSRSGKALKRDLILNFKKPKLLHMLQPNFKSKKSINIEKIILESAKKSLKEEESMPLSEIYEGAVISWIDIVYGGLKYEQRDYGKDLGFDIETVDKILQEKPEYIRSEHNNRVYYKLCNNK